MTPAALAHLHAAASVGSRAWSEAEFAEFIADPTCFVTSQEQAFALIRVVLDEAELLMIATHPDHRRQGIARQLMVDWINNAKSRGVRQAFLEVAADNAAARSLYKACGFKDAGCRKGYYRRSDSAPVDAITMICTLRD